MASRKTDAEIMAHPHWAIIENVTTHHDGDERSRTHPGHGYPAHSSTAMVYSPFETEEEAINRINTKSSYEKLLVIKAQPMRVTPTTTLSLKQ